VLSRLRLLSLFLQDTVEPLLRPQLFAMEVKNTFIDVPSTPMVGVQSFLNTAPAQYAAGFSMKDSLAQAAGSDMSFASPAPAVLSEAAVATLNMSSRPRRAKPNELAFMSTQSMMSIPESPMAGQMAQLGQPVVVNRKRSSMVSIPPTPAGMMDWGSTPTGTPYGGGYTMLPMNASAPVATLTSAPVTSVTTMAAPAAARWADSVPTPKAVTVAPSKQTLSLGSMIPSPKAGTLTAAFSQMYAAPMVSSAQPVMMAPPSAPPMMAPTLTGSMISMPPAYAPNFPPPPMNAPVIMAAPRQASAVVQSGRVAGTSQPSAAGLLGLLSSPKVSQQVAVGTLQSSQPSAARLTTTTVQQLAPATAYAQPAAVTYAQPAQATMNFPREVIPPPPMCSPKGLGSPIVFSAASAPAPSSAQSDFQVLYDMAVASGNQQAVEALKRQAQQSGVTLSQ